jgi:hypothetical protein
MNKWNTFGAMGSTIVELSTADIIRLLMGKEVPIGCGSAILCFGKSKRTPEGEREKIRAQIAQLKAAGM